MPAPPTSRSRRFIVMIFLPHYTFSCDPGFQAGSHDAASRSRGTASPSARVVDEALRCDLQGSANSPRLEIAMRRFFVIPLSAKIACGVLVIFAMTRAPAQMAAAPQQRLKLEASLLDDLVAPAASWRQKGVLDALGHVSVRDPHNPNRYWMSRSLAPALVTPADIMEFDVDGNPIDRKGRTLYVERFIHGEIYKARADVNAIVHSHSPTVIPFSVTKVPLQPVLHNASFLAFGAPVFDASRTIAANSDLLINTPALGAALAEALGRPPRLCCFALTLASSSLRRCRMQFSGPITPRLMPGSRKKRSHSAAKMSPTSRRRRQELGEGRSPKLCPVVGVVEQEAVAK